MLGGSAKVRACEVRTSSKGGRRPCRSGCASVSLPDVEWTLKLNRGNFEGAFPLLLIGSALLVYCAVLRTEAIASTGSRFPLWGIVGAVGAVIAGSGVFSIFLDNSEGGRPTTPDGFVLVPKAEWDVVRPRPPTTTKSVASVPPWWEGPGEPSEPAPPRPTARTITRDAARSTSPHGAPVVRAQLSPATPAQAATTRAVPAPVPPKRIAPAATKPRPASPPPPKGSLEELRQSLAELEDMVNNNSRSTARTVTKAGRPRTSSCADCAQEVANSPAPNLCAGCGRRLCVDCALSSQFEDADLRCNECRARQS